MSHLLQDVVYEARPELEFVLASYHHLCEGAERALSCDLPDCHHRDIDRESVRTSYHDQLAEICHQLVKIIDEAM